MEHILSEERSEFENKCQVTWCRRCGRMIVNDRFPENVTKKPCQIVRIELR